MIKHLLSSLLVVNLGVSAFYVYIWVRSPSPSFFREVDQYQDSILHARASSDVWKQEVKRSLLVHSHELGLVLHPLEVLIEDSKKSLLLFEGAITEAKQLEQEIDSLLNRP